MRARRRAASDAGGRAGLARTPWPCVLVPTPRPDSSAAQGTEGRCRSLSSMSDVVVLTEAGVTGLSYEAILWLVERATLEFPEGTLDRLDDGLREGVVALNASDLEAIAAFFYEQLERTD